jgi:hypothetical protein
VRAADIHLVPTTRRGNAVVQRSGIGGEIMEKISAFSTALLVIFLGCNRKSPPSVSLASTQTSIAGEHPDEGRKIATLDDLTSLQASVDSLRAVDGRNTVKSTDSDSLQGSFEAFCPVDPSSGYSRVTLDMVQASVLFQKVKSPDMAGFNKHFQQDSQTAWYNRSRGEVLVTNSENDEAISITGFPKQLGCIGAAGWRDGTMFWIHLSPGADFGIMVYCDLATSEVTKIERWAAW